MLYVKIEKGTRDGQIEMDGTATIMTQSKKGFITSPLAPTHIILVQHNGLGVWHQSTLLGKVCPSSWPIASAGLSAEITKSGMCW